MHFVGTLEEPNQKSAVMKMDALMIEFMNLLFFMQMSHKSVS